MPFVKQTLVSSIKHAVVDVGSNSVRLVIYRIIGKAFIPIHNEKTLAALGRGVGATQMLSPEGVQMAMDALQRFKLLLDSLNITNIDAIATAAIREAKDGKAFIDKVKREIGLEIKVISGEDEGRLSALGVEFGAPNSKGFMGDLGGSSLELVSFESKAKIGRESWQLGPLALGDLSLSRNIVQDKDKTKAAIKSVLEKSKVLKSKINVQFHAVGGAWRSLAHIHMVYRNYPLHVLHNYKISRADVLQICDFVASQSRKSLERIAGVSSRRADTLPYAALLMREIVSSSNCDEVVVSSFGLREGVLVEKYAATNSSNPLIESVIAHANLDEMKLEFANALYVWLKPILSNELLSALREFDPRLIYAICILANMGMNYHPDHRAYLTYELILRAPFAGIFHAERVFLARAIACRYGAKRDYLDSLQCAQLIDDNAKLVAEKIGLGIRFGANMCSNSAKLLEKTSLLVANEFLIMEIDSAIEPIYSTQVQRRHQQFATVFSLKPKLNTI